MMKVISCCLAAVVIAAMLGCGDSNSATGGAPPVEDWVTDIPDAATSPESFRALFADGVTVPEKDRKKYSDGYFLVESQGSGPDGTTILKLMAKDVMGNDKGQVEWTVVEQGGEWKLKSAPLP